MITRFRAWVKDEALYRDVCNLSYDEDGRLDTVRIRDERGVVIDWDYKPDDLILEPYISKYDCQETEICVGDLIRDHDYPSKLYEVRYNMDDACFVLWDKLEKWEATNFRERATFDFEIVGNIHEGLRA